MTASEIFTEARRLLQDTVEPYRWEDARMHDALQLGVDALAAIRPETRYVEGRDTGGLTIPADDGDEFPIHRRYKDALVCFVAHRCYADDATDTVNQQLSENYLGKFEAKARS